jgi:uncharacterized protein GlcG (DUF336 family)
MHTRWFSVLAAVVLVAPVVQAQQQLIDQDVFKVLVQGVTRAARIQPNAVIAVVDREGYVLGVWNVAGGEPTQDQIARAVSKAGTAAFLSSNNNAFTTRTAGFIIQNHFPPGVRNAPPGPLVGVGFSNLPFSDVNRFKQFFGAPGMLPPGASPGTLGFPVPGTSLSGSPGGVPLYKAGQLVGGVGVTGDGTEGFVVGYDRDEDIALAAQKDFAAPSGITADRVFINGFSLAYTSSSTAIHPIVVRGNISSFYHVQNSPPPFPYPVVAFGGVLGQLRQPIINDPVPGDINGQPRLTAPEIEAIMHWAADRVRSTRAGIRLPIGTRMDVFISVVNNPNDPTISPAVLGVFRTGDATMFSWDVSVQKARTAVGFSDAANAFSTRTVGFLAQQNFPPGIDTEGPGPFFGLQETLSATPTARFPNGITIFPGGLPLYRNGQLIGAIGISGDGVEQDDIVAASGAQGFLPPELIRADYKIFNGVRLPYARFPRDPEIGGSAYVPVHPVSGGGIVVPPPIAVPTPPPIAPPAPAPAPVEPGITPGGSGGGAAAAPPLTGGPRIRPSGANED